MPPTFGDCWYRLREGVKLFADARTHITTTSGTCVVDNETTILGDNVQFDSDIANVYSNGLRATRAAFSAPISGANLRNLMDPCLIQMSRAIGKPQTNPLACLPIIYDYMALNTGAFPSAPRLESRTMTFGSWSATAGNVGTGTLNRLTVDQYGLPLESGFAETKTFQCFADYQSGTNPGQEQFNCLGEPFRDSIARYNSSFGSGINASTGVLTGITGDTTQALLLNPSFSDYSGTNASSSFALSNWTLSSGSAASMSVNTTNYYRKSAIEQTAGALAVTGSVTLTQRLATRAGALDPTQAYYWQFAANREIGSWSGTITLTIGSNATCAITMAAQTGWQIVRPTINKNLYFYNFNTNDLTVTLTITHTSGTLYIDDILWAPYTNIDGTLFALVGGATNFKYYDSGTVTDSEGTNQASTAPIMQRAFNEAYGWCMPAYDFTERPAAATAATGAAGNVTAGLHRYVYTRITSGQESLPSTPVSIGCNGATKVDLSDITVGGGSTTARKVYGTTAGGNTFYLITTIADNVTTTYSVDITDANLAVAANQLGPIPDSL